MQNILLYFFMSRLQRGHIVDTCLPDRVPARGTLSGRQVSRFTRNITFERIYIQMDIAFSATEPSKLYAILLRSRPLLQGTLMPCTGEVVHAPLLSVYTITCIEPGCKLNHCISKALFHDVAHYLKVGVLHATIVTFKGIHHIFAAASLRYQP